MRITTYLAALALCLSAAALSAGPARAACPIPADNPGIGDYPQGEICELVPVADNMDAIALAVSDDGTVIVGVTQMEAPTRAVSWGPRWGIYTLPPSNVHSSLSWTAATDVSADGSVIVGSEFNPMDDSGVISSAIRWVGSVPTRLPMLASDHVVAYAHAVSGDGRVTVGETSAISGFSKAVRWVGTGTPQDLGLLPNKYGAVAAATDRDGDVVVGKAYAMGNNASTAFRWTAATDTMVDLGTLTGHVQSEAMGVSDDGSVVVGNSYDATDQRAAFRWTTASGGMQALTVPTGMRDSDVNAVSADGRVVVGSAQRLGAGEGGVTAHRWVGFSAANPGGTAQNLGTLTGHAYSEAKGVSGDGSVVVGVSSVNSLSPRAFIWKAAGTMEDRANLLASYGVLADDQAAAVAQHARAVGRVTGRSCLAQPGANCMRVGLDATYTPSGGGFGRTRQGAGTVTYGHGVHEAVTAGFSFGIFDGTARGSAVDTDLSPAFAIWARVGEPGAAGINGGFGIGYGWGDVEVTRGRGLTDVIHATGDADLLTLSLRGDIGYGVPLGVAGGDWVLTPRLGFAHDRAKRTGYTETGASFNATYDAVTASRTQGSLALDADAAFAGHDLGFSLGIEVGADQDIAINGSAGGVPGLANLDVESDADYARLRPFAGARYARALDDRTSLGVTAGVARNAYGDRRPEMHLGLGLTVRF